jgi:hypothetical protein
VTAPWLRFGTATAEPATAQVADHPELLPGEPTKGRCFLCQQPVTWHRPARNTGNVLEGLVNAFGDPIHLRCPPCP